MPILVSGENVEDPLFARLRDEGVAVLSRDAALHQDIRPARIALLNLMPAGAMEATEVQWLRHIGDTILQIDPVLLKFDDDEREREGAARSEILPRYQSVSEAMSEPLDGLIVTGANLETKKLDNGQQVALPFEDIRYASQLKDVIDRAKSEVPYTIYSCLGAHFALNHMYGLERTLAPAKVFGVYDHLRTRAGRTNPFTHNINDVIRAPHSRWGKVPVEEMRKVGALSILAASDEIGWLLASAANEAGGSDLFIQGHPEYQRFDLHNEYVRDRKNGQTMPVGYYYDDDPTNDIQVGWVSDARALHTNWIRALYNHLSADKK
jgi:homoserine O-succinyltransferase